MTEEFLGRKDRKKIIMLTAYDYQTAAVLSGCAVDLLLVGDSLGEVFQGKTSTKSVTMEEMLYHTAAVARGAGERPVVADMPIHSYDTPAAAIANARRFLAAGAKAVKVEGYLPGLVRALRQEGIHVMGHVGLLPQSAPERKVMGKDPKEAARIKAEARGLSDEGVFAVVLECLPEGLAAEITRLVAAPTIGIGAGCQCDGQVLVINDLLGLDRDKPPKFVKRYADLAGEIERAVNAWSADVASGAYPDDAHTYH